MNEVQFENLDLSHEISCILSVFDKIILYLQKQIINLQNINAGESLYSSNQLRKSQILLIFGEITTYLRKKEKKKHFKLISCQKSRNFTDF